MKIILFTIILMCVFFGCVDKSTPEYTAKQYLIALKNKDWEKARNYATNQMKQELDMIKALDGNYRITEIKDVKCEDRGSGTVECKFCCSLDSTFNTIFLIKSQDGWQVLSSKGMIW